MIKWERVAKKKERKKQVQRKISLVQQMLQNVPICLKGGISLHETVPIQDYDYIVSVVRQIGLAPYFFCYNLVDDSEMVPRYYSQNTVLDYAALKAAFPASADKVHT